MYTNCAKRRSRLKDKFLVVVLAAIICLVVTSPFVLSWGDGIGVERRVVEAYDFSGKLDEIADRAGFDLAFDAGGAYSLTDMIGDIISSALALIGVVFLIIAIVAGYRWMMAGGNEETVANAKKTLSRAIVGVVIVLSAYAITYYVVNALLY